MGFVLIKTFGNYIEANIALSMLEQEGINCHIEDENTLTILNMASGMRLMVYETQVERAFEILQDAEKEYLNNLLCPDCNHRGFEIKYVKESHESGLNSLPFGRIFAFLSKTLSKEGTTMEVKHYVCSTCKKEFNDLPS
jgi:DNA-directed RNA polymerase subunit RPC12/RpoP